MKKLLDFIFSIILAVAVIFSVSLLGPCIAKAQDDTAIESGQHSESSQSRDVVKGDVEGAGDIGAFVANGGE